MPDYRKQGDLFIVSYVTGPSHVRLGIRFSSEPRSSPTLTRLPPVGECDHGPLEESRIVESVNEGVSRANDKHHTHMRVAEIHYVANDSPRYDLFRHCAFLIADGVQAGAEFRDAGWSFEA